MVVVTAEYPCGFLDARVSPAVRYAQQQEVPLKRFLVSTTVVLAPVFALACGDASMYDAPADHTTSQEGAMHKPGLKQPTTNCSPCHGTDLKGGTARASCYECHGQKW